jgi:hypothetical protein
MPVYPGALRLADEPGVISHLYGWTVRQQLFWIRRDQRQSRHSLTGRFRLRKMKQPEAVHPFSD